ncbi:MAG: universal stress protein, partial [Oscillospiraceae bacterium]|nr:universal stress protein [Oscillospiraceae bacterium]
MVRILAATDFSEEGQAVLDFAAEMVCKTGGKMYLLHAVEPCIIDAAGSLSGGGNMGAGDIPGNLPNVDYQRMDA